MPRSRSRSHGQILLVSENDYLPALLKILDHARESIDIMAFSFAIGSAGGKLAVNGAPYEIAEKLIALKKKRKALQIRLYIEGERETADRNSVTAEFLKKGGVKIKYGATHAKGFCIDGRYVLFGSTNLTQQSITKNNETNFFIDDRKIAQGFMKYFMHLWNGGRHGGVKLAEPLYADGAFKKMLIALIDSAEKRIEFSIYFFKQSDIEKALIRAQKRGVKITGFIHDHFAFALSYVRRTRGTVKRLFEAGVKDLHMAPPHLFTHSKYVIVDQTTIALGTGNWLDEDVEIHPQLYIKLEDQKLARALGKHLAKQIKKTGTRYR